MPVWPHLWLVALGLIGAVAGLIVVVVWLVVGVVCGLRRRPGPSRRWLLAGLLVVLGPLAARGAIRWRQATVDQTAVDLAMIPAAFRPAPVAQVTAPPGYQLLAGDLHCHISPPDVPYHASRGLDDTVRLARAEGLDFVGLTPHVWTHLLADPRERAALLDGQRELRERLARTDTGGVLFTVGAESTDDTWGHVGLLFGDFEQALAGVTDDEVATDLSGLFTRHVRSGGLLFIHHPLLQPIAIRLPGFGLDISWRPFTSPDVPPPAHIRTVTRLAAGIEADNLLVSALRDRIAFGDDQKSVREVLALIDRQIVQQQRRLVPVGGSDSHSYYTRGLTYVLARERSLESIREAMLAGRVCVRDPHACGLEVRRPGGEFHPVGASFLDVDAIELRVPAGQAEVLRNGTSIAHLADASIVRIPTPRGACSLVRIVASGGHSAPVYANCPFASPHESR